MSKFIVAGGKPLRGKVKINGAKNSVLPIIAACLLADGKSIIDEVPNLEDVNVMCDILEAMGVAIKRDYKNRRLEIEVSEKVDTYAPYSLVSRLRASFLILGPILAREGRVTISMPGGCAIGTRPVDLHLKGFTAMGAEIQKDKGVLNAHVTGKLAGSVIYLDFPSVGATENILMASVLADGKTVIENAASEPEIADLAAFLNAMGAHINGAGTDTITIEGVKYLKGVRHTIIPDRIEAGTFMAAAAITGGDLVLENVVSGHLKPILAKLKECGMEISEELSTIHLKSPGRPEPIDIKTLPFPGFPTDMQAQISSVMSISTGTSIIIETIFENRFMHFGELKRMGAEVKVDGRSAVIEGKSKLTGAQVKATDLRAGAALVIAALAAEGSTEIDNIEHIDRGYVDMDKRLNSIGAGIHRVD